MFLEQKILLYYSALILKCITIKHLFYIAAIFPNITILLYF